MQQLFEENNMQRLRPRFAPIRSWIQSLPQPTSIALVIALHILLLYGLAAGLMTATEAQPSQPSTTQRGFIPAKPIRHLHRFPPYPMNSLMRGEEGTVSLNITISENGRVSNVKILRSSGSQSIDRSTASWVKSRWRYYPATLNGKPVISNININITFALKS